MTRPGCSPGRVAAAPVWRSWGKVLGPVVTAGCLWLIFVTVSAWPNYLSYFNTASGGTERGHKYLLDSNVDWGQSLKQVADYVQTKRITNFESGQVFDFDWSRDGRELALIRGSESSDVIMIRNFR